MDLISALSLGELALSFSRVPLFPVFDLSYFIVSIIYLKYEPGESEVVRATRREVALDLMTEARRAGRIDPGAGWGRRQRLRSWSAPTLTQVEEGGNPGDRGAVERGLQMRWVGSRGEHLFTVRRAGAAG